MSATIAALHRIEMHGIRGRALRGTAANPAALALAPRFERSVALALEQVPVRSMPAARALQGEH